MPLPETGLSKPGVTLAYHRDPLGSCCRKPASTGRRCSSAGVLHRRLTRCHTLRPAGPRKEAS